MKVTFPFPPTVNTLFTNMRGSGGKRRVPTSRYRTWKRQAMNEIMVQDTTNYPGFVQLNFVFCPRDKRKRDLSNYIKAPEDILVVMGIIEDDSKVKRLSAEWGRENSVEVTAHENSR